MIWLVLCSVSGVFSLYCAYRYSSKRFQQLPPEDEPEIHQMESTEINKDAQ